MCCIKEETPLCLAESGRWKMHRNYQLEWLCLSSWAPPPHGYQTGYHWGRGWGGARVGVPESETEVAVEQSGPDAEWGEVGSGARGSARRWRHGPACLRASARFPGGGVAGASWLPAGLRLLAPWVLFSAPRPFFLACPVFSFCSCKLHLASLPPWLSWPPPGEGGRWGFSSRPSHWFCDYIYSTMTVAPAVNHKYTSVHSLGFKPNGKPGADEQLTVGVWIPGGDLWRSCMGKG